MKDHYRTETIRFRVTAREAEAIRKAVAMLSRSVLGPPVTVSGTVRAWALECAAQSLARES